MKLANFLSVASETATVAGTLMREHWHNAKNNRLQGCHRTWLLQWIGNVSGGLLKCCETIFQTIQS